MALTEATITYDLSDLTGTDFDSRRTKVWVSTNVPSDTVIDTDGNQIRLGSGNGTVNSDGTGSVTVWVPGVGSNPASWQTYVHVDYPDRHAPRNGRQTRTFGPFTITASADLADLVDEQEIPPDYAGELVATVEAGAEAAAASATSAAASAEAASVIAGLTGEDAAVAFLVGDSGSDTAAALSATIATEAKARGASSGEVYVDDYPRTGGETTDEGRIQRAEDALAAARGGTLVFGPHTYTIAAPIIKRRGVSWRGQGVDINYEVATTDPTQERGSCILQASTFVGDELVKFDSALTVQSSYPITISGVSFRGRLTAPKVGIRVQYAHLAKIIFCRFSSLSRAIHSDAIVEVLFNFFDVVQEQVYLSENCTESLVAFNHGNALYRAIVVMGDGHRIIGNKLYGDVRDASYASPNPRSVAGVYIYGTRNVISGNYIDQWMHAGVIIDSSLTSTAAYGYGTSFFGPYGNTISANVISNCGHGTYTASGTGDTDPDAVLGVSAGVVLLVAARPGGDPVQPKIYRNIITGNVIESGYTKGWTLAGTTTVATKVGVHMIGLVAGDIYDNVIDSNTYDSELVTQVLAHNGAVASNKVGTYRGDTKVGASLPPKSAHWYAAVSRDITATVMVNQRLTVAPIFLSSVTKITDLAFEVTTAGEASSTFTPAIYADDGQGAAGALVYGGTATSTSTTGVKTLSGLSLTLEPGWYWIGGLTLNASTTPPALRTNGQSLAQGISGATSAAVVLATPVMGAQQNSLSSLPSTMTPALNGSAAARVAYKAAL